MSAKQPVQSKAKYTRLGRLWEFVKWWLPLFALSLLPMFSNWLSNRYQVSAQDLMLPILLSAGTAAVVAAAFYRLSKRDRLAALGAAVPATLVLASNVEARLAPITPFFAAFNPTSLSGAAYTVAFAALVLVLAWWLGRVVSYLVTRWGWNTGDIATGIVVAVVATFVFQFFSVAYDLAAEWPQFFYRPPKLAAAPAAAKAATKPDIYYIVMEDYASNDVLQKQFSFNNDNFTDYLEQKGYKIDPTAKVNYPFTAMSVASTLSANYLNDLVAKFHDARKQSVVPFNATTRNAPVAQALQSIGYTYSLIGNWYEAFNLSESANQSYQWNGLLTVMGHTFTLNNFPKLVATNSLWGRFLQMGIRVGHLDVLSYENMGDVDLAHAQLSKLKELADQPAGGRFIMSDILVPHEPPFYFNADGSINPNSDGNNVGEPLKQKYLNSVQYINGQMKGILDTIDRKSGGKAVVVLVSDEGPQLQEQSDSNDSDLASNDDALQTGDMRQLSNENLQLKYGTFSAVKLPGVADSALTPDSLSSVNVFRTVLDQYFGYNLPALPNCYYAYPNGRDKPIIFTDITKQLTGQAADSKCLNNGTVVEP